VSLGKACTHGVAWSRPCLRCEKVSVTEFLKWAEPKVARMKEKLAQLERSILADEMEAERTSLVGRQYRRESNP
jgi:hypothetical protein